MRIRTMLIIIGIRFVTICAALALPKLSQTQAASAASWALPRGLKVKGTGRRAYRFTVVYNTANSRGKIFQRQRLTAKYIRGLPGGQVTWKNVTQATAVGPTAPFGPVQKCDYMDGFRYRNDLANTSKPDFFRKFPPTAVMERNLVWDTGMIEMFGQDYFDHLALNKPYQAISNGTATMPGVGTFDNRDVVLEWIGNSRHNGQNCALIQHQAFFNPLDLHVGGVSLKGRSDYWGMIWVSVATKQIEYGTIYESMVGEMKLAGHDTPQTVNVFRSGSLEPISMQWPKGPGQRCKMEETKQDWAFSLLWSNLAVAIVVLILFLNNQISGVQQLLHVLAYTLIYANIVVIFALLLVERLAKSLALHKPPLILLLAFCIVVIVPVGCLLVQTLLMAIGVVVPQHFWREYISTLRVSMPLAAVFGVGTFVHLSLRQRLQSTKKALREKELAEEHAQKLAVEARLRSLESRIQPHFLFNTLNSISSLIAVDPARAEIIVGRLATLLRASLDTRDRPLIPLREELAMMESYIDIEHARFGDKLRASVKVPAELEEVRVAPMSVQALVENAVKHGITPKVGGGEIYVAASAEDSNVRIEVSDSGCGFDLAVVPPGHGLDNLVDRLNALFGENARLNAFKRDGHSIVEMILPRV